MNSKKEIPEEPQIPEEQVESLAGLFLSIEDIAIAMEWNEEETEDFQTALLIKDKSHRFYNPYHKGRLTAKIELRQSVKQAAKNGSNPAQNFLLDFLRESEL